MDGLHEHKCCGRLTIVKKWHNDCVSELQKDLETFYTKHANDNTIVDMMARLQKENHELIEYKHIHLEYVNLKSKIESMLQDAIKNLTDSQDIKSRNADVVTINSLRCAHDSLYDAHELLEGVIELLG